MAEVTTILAANIDGITYEFHKLPNGYARITATDNDSGGEVGSTVYPDFEQGAAKFGAMTDKALKAS